MLHMILVFLNWDLFCGLKCDLSWKMFMCIWKECIFCCFWMKYYTHTHIYTHLYIESTVCFMQGQCFLIDVCLDDLSINVSGVIFFYYFHVNIHCVFQCSHVGSIYNLPLNNTRLNFVGSLIGRFFLKIIHSTILHSPFIFSFQTWIQREDSKVIWKLLTAWGLVPLTSTLFKDQLYI